MRIDAVVAIVTGAASGLGAATAPALRTADATLGREGGDGMDQRARQLEGHRHR